MRARKCAEADDVETGCVMLAAARGCDVLGKIGKGGSSEGRGGFCRRIRDPAISKSVAEGGAGSG